MNNSSQDTGMYTSGRGGGGVGEEEIDAIPPNFSDGLDVVMVHIW